MSKLSREERKFVDLKVRVAVGPKVGGPAQWMDVGPIWCEGPGTKLPRSLKAQALKELKKNL